MAIFITLLLTAYLAGSVNFSIILFRLMGRSDPRAQFSGNPGTTNVYRQAGLLWAILVLLLDFSRAMGVSWLAIYYLPMRLVPWVGLVLILGNRFPCFHGFKGGKGVANYMGFFAMITGWSVIYAMVAWVTAYGLFRKPFIASFFLILTLGALVVKEIGMDSISTSGVAVTVAFIIANHRQNMIELLKKDNPI